MKATISKSENQSSDFTPKIKSSFVETQSTLPFCLWNQKLGPTERDVQLPYLKETYE
jgi:hypothetical protein